MCCRLEDLPVLLGIFEHFAHWFCCFLVHIVSNESNHELEWESNVLKNFCDVAEMGALCVLFCFSLMLSVGLLSALRGENANL